MSDELITKDQVYLQLKKCIDPEIPVNIVDLGLIYGVEIKKEKDVD
ncbi:MAG TPA: iron-sulfur cluster assembly protein, partial [Nitrososphaeraceae archaeon]|nr:iron-sulfur cluster assembly protein [Nitrososphaeraceae archaeon]